MKYRIERTKTVRR